MSVFARIVPSPRWLCRLFQAQWCRANQASLHETSCPWSYPSPPSWWNLAWSATINAGQTAIVSTWLTTNGTTGPLTSVCCLGQERNALVLLKTPTTFFTNCTSKRNLLVYIYMFWATPGFCFFCLKHAGFPTIKRLWRVSTRMRWFWTYISVKCSSKVSPVRTLECCSQLVDATRANGRLLGWNVALIWWLSNSQTPYLLGVVELKDANVRSFGQQPLFAQQSRSNLTNKRVPF